VNRGSSVYTYLTARHHDITKTRQQNFTTNPIRTILHPTLPPPQTVIPEQQSGDRNPMNRLIYDIRQAASGRSARHIAAPLPSRSSLPKS
jgi:hypothetical protein